MPAELDAKTQKLVDKAAADATKAAKREFKDAITKFKELVTTHAEDAGTAGNPDAKKRLKTVGKDAVEILKAVVA